MGATLFGDNGTITQANTFTSIAALRAINSSLYSLVFVQGYYTNGDGGGGNYWHDLTDIISVDNGGTIIVAADGGRWKLNLQGNLIDPAVFGAKYDGGDDTVAVKAALAAATALTGPQYSDTMGQAPFGYGVARGIKLSGKKCGISSTLTPANNVGIFAFGGGFLALAGFPAGTYMIDTGVNPYCGRINDLVLDGGGLNVKGININNAFMTRWKGLSVINCANDSIVVTATGPEFFLDTFDVVTSGAPLNNTVAGIRVFGSDGNYNNGVVKFSPVGVVVNGGGNNNFTGIHTWGEYDSFKNYVPFWLVNASRNTFVGCYADSPTKQDYTQAVNAIVNGIPNGGVCFIEDVNSAQNQFIGGRGFVSTTLWNTFTAAWSSVTAYTPQRLVTQGGVLYCCILGNTNQLPPNATYWTAIATNQFVLSHTSGSFNQFLSVNYNYAGNWLTDHIFSTTAIQDSCLVIGSPNVPAGLFPARLGLFLTNSGGTARFTVTNGDLTANAASTAQVAYNINNSDIAADIANYGAAGVSYVVRSINGVEKHRSTSRGLELTGGMIVLKSAVAAVAAGEVGFGNNTATVVGGAGGAAALPATPLGYLVASVGGTAVKIPYYNN